jgi:hypothetical protein
MSGTTPVVNPPTPTTDSCTISTRSGHPPGTPKREPSDPVSHHSIIAAFDGRLHTDRLDSTAPIDPPRRRSSLGFSQFFTWSSPPRNSNGSPKPSNKSDLPRRTPSNTSRKRMLHSANRSTVTPGHVTQMQKLFQSAKASLRLDMAFAASPTGSIESRLPTDKITPAHSPTDAGQEDKETPVKDWRYSLAPQLLAASDMDVREPVPEGSPTLPGPLELRDDCNTDPALEPLSSGFNSPDGQPAGSSPNFLSITEVTEQPEGPDKDNRGRDEVLSPLACDAELERTMTELKVCSDDEDDDMGPNESPIVSHLKRMSAETSLADSSSKRESKKLFLSEPAEAAAESAKAKRSLLRSLFPRKDHRLSPSPVSESASLTRDQQLPASSPCPDPTLHRLMSMGVCPDPLAHLRSSTPNTLSTPMISMSPEEALSLTQNTPSPVEGASLPPVLPFHRASATGSPMPFVRQQTSISSPEPHNMYQCLSGPQPSHAWIQRSSRHQTQNGYLGMASEHFQPGWYYAREPAQPARRLNPMTYSFSTAAAKVGGQSAAPDSRIRDSYRTDTLTPLAKPPSRFRKTGIGALANNRGVSKYYDGPEGMDSRVTRPGTSRSNRARNDVQFRSSPPRVPENMVHAHQKRRRPRELEDDQFDIHEDGPEEAMGVRHITRLEEGEELLEVDQDTTAAVRMSLYGPETPEALQGAREGIRELSPNVTPWRKGMRQPRKKRRPSYWDGDLKQVRDSPAAKQAHTIHPGAERQVMTSPAKEDIESMTGQEGLVSVRSEEAADNVDNMKTEIQETVEETPLDEVQEADMVDKMDVEV